MLDHALREQLLRLFEGLEASYVFDVTADPGHASRGELLELLEETAACSAKIGCRITDGQGLEFRLLRNDKDTGIHFRAVPNGHEFSSLILAVLNADGKGKNLPDEATRRRIGALGGQIALTTYMSLTCTNCPDVVQALNLLALSNPRITHTAVDGALFPEEVARLNIQAVAAVFHGEELIYVGRGSLAELLDKLEERFGTSDTGITPHVREYDLLVAGGGPAGASAAIYAARKGLRVAVVAEKVGGQVNETVGIENLISVPRTTGAELAGDLRRHMEAYGIDICDNRRIERFDMDGGIRELHAKGGEVFRAPALVVATGASWRRLGVPGEAEYIGRGSLAELLDKLEERFGTSDTGITPHVREYDLLVAGGGPAGASAAIYAARKGLRVAVVAEKVGGQVNETVGIENLISVPRTTGAELAGDLRRHMEAYGIDICDNRRIERFDMDGGIRELHAKGGEVFRAPALVVATGASWRRLGVPGEAEYIGRGVAFCPHCDGPFYAGRHVAVIGGGNSGVEAAIDLAGTCASVTVLEFMETLKADQVLQEKLRTLPNVEVHTNVQTLEVEGDGSRMTALRTKDRSTGAEKRLPLDGVFVQIGLSANSKLFAGILDTNRAGEILTDKECRTSVPGVYAAGDVTDIRYKQIVIAMGEGAKAALSASEDRIKGII